MIGRSAFASNLHLIMLVSGLVTLGFSFGASLYRGQGLAILAVPICILPAQLSVIALVIATSNRPLAERLWHAAIYACGIYYALLVPPALVADRYGYFALVSADTGYCILAAYAFVLGFAFRASAQRLTLRYDAPRRSVKFQFRLIDLMKVITLVCVALGLRATIVAEFSSIDPLIPWLGYYYRDDIPDATFVRAFCGWTGGPLTLINLVMMWAILGDHPARRKCMFGLGILWVAITSFATVTSTQFGSLLPVGVALGLPLIFLPAALHALAMYWQGWRIVSTDSPQGGTPTGVS